MAISDLVLGITGASGAPYAIRLLEILVQAGRQVHVTMSPAAVQVFQAELGLGIDLKKPYFSDLLSPDIEQAARELLLYHHYMDFSAGIASGSFRTGGMVVCPCSMGTISAIAHGTSQNLIRRSRCAFERETQIDSCPSGNSFGFSAVAEFNSVCGSGGGHITRHACLLHQA